jgi:hypothetical protein
LRLSQNQRVAQQADKKTQRAGEQAALVEELKALAARLGFEVREEKLLREVGYRVRSGACRVREARLIFLDRDAPPSAHVDVLIEELAGERFDDQYVSPAARQRLEQAASLAAPVAATTAGADDGAAERC